MGPRRSIGLATLLPMLLPMLLMSACSIRVDDTARPVPERERGPQFGVEVTGDVAAGSGRIFLVAPSSGGQDARLRSVRRDVINDPEQIFTSLITGPNENERDASLSTNLPEGIELQSARLRGRTLTVSVNDVFNGLTPDALRLAVAQMMSTANEIDGVETLRLQIDNENVAWPIGDGTATDRLLTLYDYPGLVESSQPAYPALPSVNN